MNVRKLILSSSLTLASASGGNPIVSVGTVMLFFLFFNIFESVIELLIFNEIFAHYFDLIFTLAFIAYAGLSVYSCAVFNSENSR